VELEIIVESLARSLALSRGEFPLRLLQIQIYALTIALIAISGGHASSEAFNL